MAFVLALTERGAGKGKVMLSLGEVDVPGIEGGSTEQGMSLSLFGWRDRRNASEAGLCGGVGVVT